MLTPAIVAGRFAAKPAKKAGYSKPWRFNMANLAAILAAAEAGLIPLYINLPAIGESAIERASEQEHGA